MYIQIKKARSSEQACIFTNKNIGNAQNRKNSFSRYSDSKEDCAGDSLRDMECPCVVAAAVVKFECTVFIF